MELVSVVTSGVVGLAGIALAGFTAWYQPHVAFKQERTRALRVACIELLIAARQALTATFSEATWVPMGEAVERTAVDVLASAVGKVDEVLPAIVLTGRPKVIKAANGVAGAMTDLTLVYRRDGSWDSTPLSNAIDEFEKACAKRFR